MLWLLFLLSSASFAQGRPYQEKIAAYRWHYPFTVAVDWNTVELRDWVLRQDGKRGLVLEPTLGSELSERYSFRSRQPKALLEVLQRADLIADVRVVLPSFTLVFEKRRFLLRDLDRFLRRTRKHFENEEPWINQAIDVFFAPSCAEKLAPRALP